MKPISAFAAFASLFLLTSLLPCRGQWLTEEVALTAGWNAVYLSVQPSATDCAALFAGLPVQGVWCWNPAPRSAQFKDDPQQPLARSHDWLCWRPANHPQAFLNSLCWVQGGRGYLVQLATNSTPLTWRVKGTPVLFRREWKAATRTFTGLPVAANITSFEDFFRASSAIGISSANGGEICQVNSAGQGLRLFTPSRVKIQPTLAYWILGRDATDYAGSVRVTLDNGSGLTFPAGISTRHLLIRNESAAACTVTVRSLASESAPDASSPAVAGAVPLNYREVDWSLSPPQKVYRALDPLLSRSVEAGATWDLELSPRRAQMAGGGARYQSLLEVSDGATVRQVVGVWAE